MNKKMLIIIVIIVVVIVVLFVAVPYALNSVKTYQNKVSDINTKVNKIQNSNENANNISTELAVTVEEQESVTAVLGDVAKIIKSEDITAFNNYVEKTGNHLDYYNLFGNVAEDKKQLDFIYQVAFDQILNNKIINQKIVFKKLVSQGGFSDITQKGNEYIEMIVTGTSSLNKVDAHNISIVHKFTIVNGQWYWGNYDLTAQN